MMPLTTSSVFNTQTTHYAQNVSVPQGCIPIRFSEMEYLPWDNPDNIVSSHVEQYVGKVRNNVLVILYLIGFPANIINMMVFFKQGLKDRVNLLLFSLSLSDLTYSTALLLHYVDEFYAQFIGETKTSVLMFIVNSHVTGFLGYFGVSFLLSAIISCERCCCVMWPLRYQTLMKTETLALIIVALYVVVPGLYFIVSLKYFVGCVYDPDNGVKLMQFLLSAFYIRHKDFIDYLDVVLFGVGLPTAAVLVMTVATTLTMSKLKQSMAWRSEATSSVSDKEVALTKMLVGISVLLIVCVAPACLMRVANLFLPEMNIGGRQHNMYLVCLHVQHVFACINFSFNIFIYYKMGSRYRETFRALFKRKAVGNDKS